MLRKNDQGVYIYQAILAPSSNDDDLYFGLSMCAVDSKYIYLTGGR